MQNEIIGRLPTIPEYYKMYINRQADLTEEPKQCCPFHKEDTPSFSYSAEKRKWRCFGACKVGGDVIALHQKNYNLANRVEAEKSLKALHKVVERKELRKLNLEMQVRDDKVTDEGLYQEAILLADVPDKWIELDYLMSKTPLDTLGLKFLVAEWKKEI